MAQKALEMGLDAATVEKAIQDHLSKTGSGYSSIEALIQDCLNTTPTNDAASEGVGVCVLKGVTC